MDKTLQLKIITALQDKLSAPLKRIMGASGQSAQSLKDLRDKLKGLEQSQRQVGQFRELKAGLQKTGDALRQAQGRVDELAQRLRAAGPPTKAMQREFNQAVQAGQRLKELHRQQSVNLQGLRDRLYAAGISTKTLAAGERQLRDSITSTNRSMERQKAQLTQLAQRQRQLAAAREKMERGRNVAGGAAVAGAGGLGAGYALSRPLNAIVGAFAPAENAAMQLKASLMGSDGSVGEDFQKISDLATKLGDKLPGTTADFQDMMTMLRRQGMSSASILGGLGEATAYLGVQLQMPVTAAAEFAAKMQDATRTSEKDMMSLMDVIQRTFYIGVDSDNMLQGFTKLSPALSILRKDGLEASKMLAPLLVMMDQTGMRGESAGNALRKVFQAGMMEDKMAKANKELRSMGAGFKLDFTNGKGEFGGLDNLFKQLGKLDKLDTSSRLSVMKTIFGDDSETLQVVNTLMAKGMAGYEEVVTKMQAQADLRTRVNQQLTTLTNVAEAAQGSFTNALAEVGATAAPQLKEILEYLGDLAAGFGAWARQNPVLVGTLVKVLAAAAALAAGFGGIALSIGAVLGPMVMTRYMLQSVGIQVPIVGRAFSMLGGPLRLVGSIFMWLGRIFLMNPIGLTIMAIAFAAYLIYRYWEPLSGFFSGLWTQVKTAFDGGIAGVGALIINWSPLGLFYQAFRGVMSYLGVELPEKFTGFGSMIMTGLINGIKGMAGAVKDSVVGAASDTVSYFKEKLGINSPSRVFMELGGFVAEGAALGIQRQQPLAEKAAQIMAAGVLAAGAMAPGLTVAAQSAPLRFDTRPPIVTPAAQAGVAAALGGTAPVAPAGDHIEIHIHAAPGMQPQEIAQAVARELDRREREKQARQRSALADYGD